MSRISIVGEKVVSIRKISDETGPQMLLEAEGGTGDVFVAFDGEVVGRAFSAFMVTESGKTIQAVLRPAMVEAQTVLVRLAGADAGPASGPGPVKGERTAPAAPQDPAPRRDGFSENLVALVRLMFNGETPDGVMRTQLAEPPRRAGPLQMRPLETYAVPGLKGAVFLITNAGAADTSLDASVFMIDGVLAAALSHETLAPGRSGRLYIVEADR
jgi:hypothetical protein